MTKITGILFFLLAAAMLVITITNFTPQFAAANGIAAKQSQYGLTTTTTDLRWASGVELVVQLIVVSLIVMLGWFLYGSETEQNGYVIVVGVLILAAALIRMTPMISWNTLKVSPGTLFYGCQAKITLVGDASRFYVTLPVSDQYRIGTVDEKAPEGKGVILLDFHKDQELLTQYTQAPKPVEVLVSVSGTGTIAREKVVKMIPKAKVWKVGAQ
jgi:hypothetical protein